MFVAEGVAVRDLVLVMGINDSLSLDYPIADGLVSCLERLEK